MRKLSLLISLFLLFSAMATACAESVPESDTDHGWELRFSTVSLDGDPVTEELFIKNKLTVFNFFATWCPPCIAELPDLAETAAAYADKDVQIVGVLIDGVDISGKIDQAAVDQAKLLMSDAGADYLVILPDATIWNLYVAQIQFVPTTFFLSETGHPLVSFIGARDAETWGREIDAALLKLEQND